MSVDKVQNVWVFYAPMRPVSNEERRSGRLRTDLGHVGIVNVRENLDTRAPSFLVSMRKTSTVAGIKTVVRSTPRWVRV